MLHQPGIILVISNKYEIDSSISWFLKNNTGYAYFLQECNQFFSENGTNFGKRILRYEAFSGLTQEEFERSFVWFYQKYQDIYGDILILVL